MHATRIALFATSILGSLAAQTWAPRTWNPPQPTWRYAPFVQDAARGRSVWFSGTVDETPGLQTVAIAEHWELDGDVWVQVRPPTLPPARYLHSACYDSLRHRVLVFGGRSIPYVDRDDLWSFDGQDWTQLQPTVSPPARRAAAMAYDSARDRVVLFGGVGSIYYADTWEFDGTNWLPRSATGPTPREQASMVFDVARSVCVMTGGTNPGQGGLNTTWEYDGSAWQLRSNSTVLVPLTYDANVGRVAAKLWEWNGSNWQQSAIPPSQVAIPQAAGLVFDATRSARIAISPAISPTTQLLTVVGTSSGWRALNQAPPNTWIHDPIRQRMLALTTPITMWNGSELLPLGTTSGALAGLINFTTFDSARDEFVSVSGGSSLARVRGVDLQPLPGITAPFTTGGGIAYDSARDRYVVAVRLASLSPGAPPPVFQTWEYDGTTWQQITTATLPPAVSLPTLLYDPVRQRTVMTGGMIGFFQPLNETWEYDGIDWRRVQTAQHPTYTTFLVRLVRDSVRGLVLTQVGSTLWAYDGVNWFVDAVTPGLTPTVGAFDPIRNRLVGSDASRILEYSAGTLPTVTNFGSGCSNSSWSTDLTAEGPPILGGTFRIRLRGLPPEAGLAMVVTGFSDQSSGGASLPLGLDTLGGPSGCSLLVDAAIVTTALHVGTTKPFLFALPSTPALVGSVFFQQGAVLDERLAVPLPIATSNGLRCTAGL